MKEFGNISLSLSAKILEKACKQKNQRKRGVRGGKVRSGEGDRRQRKNPKVIRTGGFFQIFIYFFAPEIRELQSTDSIVYKYSTRPISKHLYSEIFKDPLKWVLCSTSGNEMAL